MKTSFHETRLRLFPRIRISVRSSLEDDGPAVAVFVQVLIGIQFLILELRF